MFKVGDMVRVTDHSSGVEAGRLGVVIDTNVNQFYPFRVKLDNGIHFVFRQSELERQCNGVQRMVECL
jgi:hypothetical protein